MDSKRLITGLVIGFAAYFAILFGSFWLAALVGLIIVLGAKEYTEILKNKGFLPSFKVILISAFCFSNSVINGVI